MDALQHLLFNAAPLDDMPVQADYRIKTYVIIDCASDPQHYKQLLSQDLNYANLYKDKEADKLATVAPYLIELDEEHDYTQWLLTEHWGTHSVIYIKSHYALEPLAEHFRRYTKLVVEPRENDNRCDSTEAFFAFYDPRVLKHYLTFLSREQMTELCQPVICFSYEDADQPDQLLTSYLSNSGEQWRTQTTRLNEFEIPEASDDNKTEDLLPELDDDIDVPITPVIFTLEQQDAFDEQEQHLYCRRLLNELQTHYNIDPNDQDTAVHYLKEAEKIGLHTDATQSRYILIALLIKDSPTKKSKPLKAALQQAPDENTRLHILDQALQELQSKEKKHVR